MYANTISKRLFNLSCPAVSHISTYHTSHSSEKTSEFPFFTAEISLFFIGTYTCCVLLLASSHKQDSNKTNYYNNSIKKICWRFQSCRVWGCKKWWQLSASLLSRYCLPALLQLLPIIGIRNMSINPYSESGMADRRISTENFNESITSMGSKQIGLIFRLS